jgi:hypothetical protein
MNLAMLEDGTEVPDVAGGWLRAEGLTTSASTAGS